MMDREEIIRAIAKKHGPNFRYYEDYLEFLIESCPVEDIGYVYVIGPVGGDAVKIGFSRNVEERLRHFQTSHPEQLEIVGRFFGTRHTEVQFHNTFAADRIRGEWFKRTPALLSSVAGYVELMKGCRSLRVARQLPPPARSTPSAEIARLTL